MEPKRRFKLAKARNRQLRLAYPAKSKAFCSSQICQSAAFLLAFRAKPCLIAFLVLGFAAVGWFATRNWPAKRLLMLAAFLLVLTCLITAARLVLLANNFLPSNREQKQELRQPTSQQQSQESTAPRVVTACVSGGRRQSAPCAAFLLRSISYFPRPLLRAFQSNHKPVCVKFPIEFGHVFPRNLLPLYPIPADILATLAGLSSGCFYPFQLCLYRPNLSFDTGINPQFSRQVNK